MVEGLAANASTDAGPRSGGSGNTGTGKQVDKSHAVLPASEWNECLKAALTDLRAQEAKMVEVHTSIPVACHPDAEALTLVPVITVYLFDCCYSPCINFPFKANRVDLSP